MSKRESDLLRYVTKYDIVRPHEIVGRGWTRSELARLEVKGLVVRIGRGLYKASSSAGETENHGLAQVVKWPPNAVICLLSALRFQDITTEMPYEIWLAIDNKARKPNMEYPPLHVVRFSGGALTEGVQVHVIEGVKVRIYSPAKTGADCFKYRNKIGIDVAIKALRDCRSKKLASVDEIWHFARVCRVANVMKPYLQVVG